MCALDTGERAEVQTGHHSADIPCQFRCPRGRRAACRLADARYRDVTPRNSSNFFVRCCRCLKSLVYFLNISVTIYPCLFEFSAYWLALAQERTF